MNTIRDRDQYAFRSTFLLSENQGLWPVMWEISNVTPGFEPTAFGSVAERPRPRTQSSRPIIMTFTILLKVMY